MELIHGLNFLLIFGVIIIVLWMKRPLYQAVIAGLITVVLLYQMNFMKITNLFYHSATKWSNLSVVLILYLITFLQRILEARNQIMLAYQDLDNIFHSRRVNATVASLFIGLLPSAAAMILCGDIVKEATNGYLDKQEQAFVTSWFRHIPEAALPTYPSVLLMSTITGIGIAPFLGGMVIPMILLFVLAYIPYIRKLPKREKSKKSKFDIQNLINLFKHLWTLFGILLLIIVFNLPVLESALLIIVLAIFIYRITPKELGKMVISAFDTKLLVNIFLVLILKDFISDTGILVALPTLFGRLPIPMYLVFTLLFFFGTLISGTNGIITLGGPLAFAAVPNAGLPLMVLLMATCHVANQIAPTHVCVAIAAEYFEVSLGEVIKKTLPIIGVFLIFMLGYYHILLLFF